MIWKRQIAALSAPGDRAMGAAGVDVDESETNTGSEAPLKKAVDADKVESDSDSDDEDFEAALEDEMADRTEANQLVAQHAIGSGKDAGLSQLRAERSSRTGCVEETARRGTCCQTGFVEATRR